MRAFCGIHWADHHDIAIADETGSLLARARIDDSAEGLGQLLQMLAKHDDSPQGPIPVAIETSRGLLVACLRATDRPVYAINPMAAARYRDRHTVSRKKSDHLDAMVLANILRTDAAAHRMLPADSEVAQAVAVLARAQQDAVWDRTQADTTATGGQRSRRGTWRRWSSGATGGLARLIGPVLHPDDAVANKVTTLFGRAAPRDLNVNAALASGRYSGGRLQLASEHDAGFDPRYFAQALRAVDPLAGPGVRGTRRRWRPGEDLRRRLRGWAAEILDERLDER